jgi:hypothetical protein
MNLKTILLFISTIFFLNGCATSPTWRIYTAETSKNEITPNLEIQKQIEKKNELKNTILINTETGQTWLLCPDSSGYSWKELPK